MGLLGAFDISLHEVNLSSTLALVSVLLQCLNTRDGAKELLRPVFVVHHIVHILCYLCLEGELCLLPLLAVAADQLLIPLAAQGFLFLWKCDFTGEFAVLNRSELEEEMSQRLRLRSR